MSLLSDTNHSPQRIFALLRLLDASGGEMDFDTIRAWFKPEFRDSDQAVTEGEHINIRQLIGAATSLGMVKMIAQNRYEIVGGAPESLQAFADIVHDRLIKLKWSDADSIVLEAYAAMVAITEQERGTAWLDENAQDRATRINAAVRHEGHEGGDESSRRFNNTKASPWKRWIIFLGLGVEVVGCDLYPYPVPRLVRELQRTRATNGTNGDPAIESFIELISDLMPYLDSGCLFQSAAKQIRLKPLERSLTRVLTGALRDLHDDKFLQLEAVGDTRQFYSMVGDPHTVKKVKAVHLALEPADA
jgi:hypothetical protein